MRPVRPLPPPGVQPGRHGWLRTGRSSPGSAGVPPAPSSCKQPPIPVTARLSRAGPPEPMRRVRPLPSPGVQPGRHGLFRSRAVVVPWERGRPARTFFLQTASQPPPLPCKAHQTRLYGVLFHRSAAGSHDCAKPCAGGTPALPGGHFWQAPLPPPPERSEKSLQCTDSPMKYRNTGNRHSTKALRLTRQQYGHIIILWP